MEPLYWSYLLLTTYYLLTPTKVRWSRCTGALLTTYYLLLTTYYLGAMEPLYWSPGSPIFECTMDDARTLPQRVVWFGSTSGCPREATFPKPQPQS
jgi:hypothetical protein